MSDLRLDPALTRIDDAAYVAPTATVNGDVEVASGASVWFGAVIRGDVESISVGKDTNVQDGAVLHADFGYPCTLKEGVTVGHRAIVHGATVDAHCIIGMGAIILNGAHIGEECIIGAGALVGEGKVIPPRSLVLGMPGRVKRELSEAELQSLRMSAAHYQESGAEYKKRGL